MNTNEAEYKPEGGLYKIISAVLIAVLLILIIGFAVFGLNGDEGENSGDINADAQINADKPNGDTDENNGTADNIYGESDNEAVSGTQTLSYYLTGLPCDEDIYYANPFVLLTDPMAPAYGISKAQMLIEIPVENGQTRYLAYHSSLEGLGKLGAFSPTRDYISAIVNFFGGILAANGNDDIVSYDAPAQNLHLDLAENVAYRYKENGKRIYSDEALLMSLVAKESIDTEYIVTRSLPFDFCDTDDTVMGKTKARTVTIPYSVGMETKLIYNDNTGRYTLIKGNAECTDMLTGNAAEFDNAFVLFSDMITYELSLGTQTVVSTASGGTGYYITKGTLTEIRWSVDDAGELRFFGLDGKVLVVNRGTSYISYYKAADASAVTFYGA